MPEQWHPNDLGTHVYREVAHNQAGRGWSPNTEPTSFTDALGWFLRKAGGSVSAAAALMGVPRRTARDWFAGKGAGPRNAARRAQVARSAQLSARRERLRPGREGRLRGKDPGDIVMVGTYNYSDGEHERTVRLGEYIDDPDTITALVDAYLDGADASDLRQLLAENVQDGLGFYTRTLAQPPTDDHGWTVSRLTF